MNTIKFLTLSFLISMAFFANAQTAPIQTGSALYNGDIYHRGDFGLGTSIPTARLHIIKPSLSNPYGNI